MSLLWKILLPLVLLVPVAAYAAGALATGSEQQLPVRETIVLDEVADPGPSGEGKGRGKGAKGDEGQQGRKDDGDDSGSEDGDDSDDDSDDIDVVTVEPDDYTDDRGDDDN